MSIEGDAELWSVLFPEEFIPDILDLVLSAWDEFTKPGADEEEEEITRKFRLTLIRTRDLVRLPVTILREYYEDDPDTGDHLGRIDIRFTTARSILETNYFAFECKRLNAVSGGKTRPYASEYVTKGMFRFVQGQYAGTQHHGGMIGYVLNGAIDHAMGLVNENILAKATDLSLVNATGLQVSSLRPGRPEARETNHQLEQRPFRIHHLFLAAPQAAAH
jgi:hypothetical protein